MPEKCPPTVYNQGISDHFCVRSEPSESNDTVRPVATRIYLSAHERSVRQENCFGLIPSASGVFEWQRCNRGRTCIKQFSSISNVACTITFYVGVPSVLATGRYLSVKCDIYYFPYPPPLLLLVFLWTMDTNSDDGWFLFCPPILWQHLAPHLFSIVESTIGWS